MAPRRGDRAGGGARHNLDAHPVIRDLAGIEIVAGLLQFIERLDQEIENAGSIGTSRDCPRHRETDLKFVTPFLRHFWSTPMSKCRNDKRLAACRQARRVSGIILELEHDSGSLQTFG